MEKTTWQDISAPTFSALKKDFSVDIAVVGGGLTGILTAYQLALRGKAVAVFEAQKLGSDATRQTTAFITQEIDTDLQDLVRMYGRKHARHIWESGRHAADILERIVRSENIDCDFMRCPAYIFARSPKDWQYLQKEKELAGSLGFPTSLKNKSHLPFENHGVWKIPNQAKFHPLKFLYGTAKAAADLGAAIYEQTEIKKIQGKQQFKLFANGIAITANTVIIATYDPFGNPSPTKFKKGMYNSYLYELEVPSSIFEPAIYWDMDNPYHYFRVDTAGKTDRMLLGGEDHRSELPVSKQKSFAALRQFAKQTFAGLPVRVQNKWVGPILESADGLPLIGKFADNQYVAAAFSGNGMTYAALASEIFADALTGKSNKWEHLYVPKRLPTLKQLAYKLRDYSEQFFKGAIKNSLAYTDRKRK